MDTFREYDVARDANDTVGKGPDNTEARIELLKREQIATTTIADLERDIRGMYLFQFAKQAKNWILVKILLYYIIQLEKTFFQSCLDPTAMQMAPLTKLASPTQKMEELGSRLFWIPLKLEWPEMTSPTSAEQLWLDWPWEFSSDETRIWPDFPLKLPSANIENKNFPFSAVHYNQNLLPKQ